MDIDDLLSRAVADRPNVTFTTADVVRRARRKATRRRAGVAVSALAVSAAVASLFATVLTTDHADERRPTVIQSYADTGSPRPAHTGTVSPGSSVTTTLTALPSLIARMGRFTWTHVETVRGPGRSSTMDAEVSGVLTSVDGQPANDQDIRVRIYRASATSRIPRTCTQASYFLVAGTCHTDTIAGGSKLISGNVKTVGISSGIVEVVVVQTDGSGAHIRLVYSHAGTTASPSTILIRSESVRIALTEALARVRVVR